MQRSIQPGGYRGINFFTELRPGSIQEYTKLLHEGVILKLEEVNISDPVLEGLRTLVLLIGVMLGNVGVSFKVAISNLFRRSSATTFISITLSIAPNQLDHQAIPHSALQL
jgi:hypothetical protein